jgi:hypothetical protein
MTKELDNFKADLSEDFPNHANLINSGKIDKPLEELYKDQFKLLTAAANSKNPEVAIEESQKLLADLFKDTLKQLAYESAAGKRAESTKESYQKPASGYHTRNFEENSKKDSTSPTSVSATQFFQDTKGVSGIYIGTEPALNFNKKQNSPKR